MKKNNYVKSLCFANKVLSVYSHIQTRTPSDEHAKEQQIIQKQQKYGETL